MGALLILSLTILRVNNTILSTDVVMQDSKLGVLAVSLATSIIEEASKKAFDAATADDVVIGLSALTSPYLFGPSIGETPENYNDFDDYHGYTKQDTINTIDYAIACQVNYISPDNVDGIIMEKTWHKKISVNLTSSLMNDTLKFSSVYSYWHFR